MGDFWSTAGVPGALAGVGVLALLWGLAPDERRRALRSLPAPPSTLPILGNTLDLMKFHLPRLHDWIAEQCALQKGRTWRLQMLGAPPLVVVSSAELFEDVMRTQFEVFDKGARMNTIFREAMGGGIFAVDGDQWYQQRKIMSRLFTMRAFRDTIVSCVLKYTLVLGRVLDRAAAAPEVPLDLGDTLHRYAFDVFTDVAFGLQENSLETGDRREFFDATSNLGRAIESRFHQPDWLWQLKRALGVGEERVLAASVAAIDEIVYRVIDENLQRKNDVLHQPHERAEKRSTKDIVSLFIEHSDSLQEASDAGSRTKMDPKLLRDLCASILLAGKDTTTNTMSWMVIMLNRAPHTEATIREELREVLPQLFSDPSFVPSMDEVEQLVYLEAVLRESLRLNPVVPLNAKEANRDTMLCDGTVIKEGTRIYIPSYALGRMTSVWGPDAAEFRPERWIEVDESTGKRHIRSVSAFQFPAFHAGPRICLGMRFALVEIKIAMAFMLSKYSFRTVDDPHAYTYDIAPVLVVKGPLKVSVSRV